jgi:hypothetical protein
LKGKVEMNAAQGPALFFPLLPLIVIGVPYVAAIIKMFLNYGFWPGIASVFIPFYTPGFVLIADSWRNKAFSHWLWKFWAVVVIGLGFFSWILALNR